MKKKFKKMKENNTNNDNLYSTDQEKENVENMNTDILNSKTENLSEENLSNKGTEEVIIEKAEEKDPLKIMTEKYEQANDKYVRLAAEFDNYRKRTLKEKMEMTKTAGEDIILNILPVVDNFERALKIIENAKDLQAVKDGIQLIYSKFQEFLANRSVKEIEALEKELDTDLHDAITKIPAPNDNLKGKIVDVIEKGYTLRDKVIRFAKVVVGE